MGLVGGEPHPPCTGGTTGQPSKRLRQDTKPLLNKLETEFHERLQFLYPGQDFHPQAKRFRLANGIWYKPDFTADACKNFSSEVAWEVKGPHVFRGGFENLKVAAHEWPHVQWWLVWKENGDWKQQEILP